MPRMRAAIAPPLAALLAAGLAGCSSQMLYDTAQQWQRQECHKLPDLAERQRCLDSRATSFERYQAEVEAARTRQP